MRNELGSSQSISLTIVGLPLNVVSNVGFQLFSPFSSGFSCWKSSALRSVNLSPVLTSHPRVRLAAVVGVPDELRGEEVKAFVVSDATADELTEYCADRLASFKVPRFWEFRDDLPRTPSERVAKELLR